MQDDTITQVLAELGNQTRLTIYRLLIKYGDEGLSIGSIGAQLQVPASTLSFHLRGLVEAGLVVQRKQGREVLCVAQMTVLNQVLNSLQQECCSGLTQRN